MLSVAVQDSLAATLVNDGAGLLDAAQSRAPTSVEVWLSSTAGESTAAAPLACPGPDTTGADPAADFGEEPARRAAARARPD